MNIIEALGIVKIVDPGGIVDEEYLKATIMVEQFSAQFNALAPTPEMWEKFPWAKWYTIDRQSAFFWENEPEIHSAGYWSILTEPYGNWTCDWLAKQPVVPIGTDWRLLKFERPETKGDK